MVENKRCILIADDEPKMVRALRNFFKASGFCVLEAKDGVEALDVFCENSNVIDIILLDVMMPRQDGLTTLKQIRESSSLTPVILLTAKGEEYDQLTDIVPKIKKQRKNAKIRIPALTQVCGSIFIGTTSRVWVMLA